MKKVLAMIRNVVFLWALVAFLLTTTFGAIVWGLQTAATLTAATSAAVARAVMTTKAKARIRRTVVAVPLVGLGAIVYFEEADYREWLKDNPDGTREQYFCQVAKVTAEVLDEVLQELPERFRPEPETIRDKIPKCDAQQGDVLSVSPAAGAGVPGSPEGVDHTEWSSMFRNRPARDQTGWLPTFRKASA
jgi:hypothetical protein